MCKSNHHMNSRTPRFPCRALSFSDGQGLALALWPVCGYEAPNAANCSDSFYSSFCYSSFSGDWTRWVSLYSSSASMNLGHPWPCCQFTSCASFDQFCTFGPLITVCREHAKRPAVVEMFWHNHLEQWSRTSWFDPYQIMMIWPKSYPYSCPFSLWLVVPCCVSHLLTDKAVKSFCMTNCHFH